MTGFTFGSNGKSASFAQIGDFAQGVVLDMQEVQQTDYQTKKPLTWDDGKPRMQYKITLQTDQRDPADPGDDGKRDLYVKGARKPRPDGGQGSLCAVLDAIAAAGGGQELKYGAKLTVQWHSGAGITGDPKNYAAWYEPPAYDMQQPAQHQAAPQAPPAAATPPAAPPTWAQPAAAPLPEPAAAAAPPAVPAPQAQQGWPQQPVPGSTTTTAAPAVAAQQSWPQPPPEPPTAAQAATVPGPPATPPPAAAAAAPPAAAPAPGLTQMVGNGTQGPTAEAVAGLRNAGIDPAVVYGPGWEQRMATVG